MDSSDADHSGSRAASVRSGKENCHTVILNTLKLNDGSNPRGGCINSPGRASNRELCNRVLTPVSFAAQIGARRDAKILMRFGFGEEVSTRREFKCGAKAKELAAITTGKLNGTLVAVVGERLMPVQGMPVTNRPAAFERVNPRSAPGDANSEFHNLVPSGWLLGWIINRNHLGISQALCGHLISHNLISTGF